ncbi:MAG TPA: AAA family ATPase [Coleofasciculaceae cyanobacterium]
MAVDPKSTLFEEVGRDWNLEGLYRDLGHIKARILATKDALGPHEKTAPAIDPRRSQLSATERLHLRGLLKGLSIRELATELDVTAEYLRTELTNRLYTYLKCLLNWEGRFCRRKAMVLLMERYHHPLETQPPLNCEIQSYLPARDSTQLEGRDRDYERLSNWLQSNISNRFFVIEGAGGTGKTALALEVAHRLVRQDDAPFRVTLFVSAQVTHLTGIGLIPSFRSQQTLEAILAEIAHNLDFDGFSAHSTLIEQIHQIWDRLAQQPTLLIVDSFEALAEPERVLAFLYDLPATVKVLITSRQRLYFPQSIHLDPLDSAAVMHWIEHHGAERAWPWSAHQYRSLVEAVGGLPGAIDWALGQLATGQSIQWVIAQLHQPDHWVTQFYCQSTIAALQGTLAGQLLALLSWFAGPIDIASLAQVAGVNPHDSTTMQALAELAKQSIVTILPNGRYSLPSLLRRYIAAQCSQILAPEAVAIARDRWIQWAIDYAQRHGHPDRLEWLSSTHELDPQWPTLSHALDYCLDQGQLQHYWDLFQPLRGYTHFRGHWADRIARNTRGITLARQQNDPATEALFLFDRGWTRSLHNDPASLKQAQADFQAAWELRQHTSIELQTELAINQQRLASRQGSSSLHQQWQAQMQQLIAHPDINQNYALRLDCQNLYYQGDLASKQQDYPKALQLYTAALKQAQTLQWKRGEAYIQSSIGATNLALGHFHKAWRYLEDSYRIAINIPDQRCLAYCQKHLAHTAKELRPRRDPRSWAEKAIALFHDLGITDEAQIMRDFIQTLETR